MNKKILLVLPILAFSVASCSQKSNGFSNGNFFSQGTSSTEEYTESIDLGDFGNGGDTGREVTVAKPKGEEIAIDVAAPLFVDSLIASFNHEAIGITCDDLKLNAVFSGHYPTSQRRYNSANGYYDYVYRLINFAGNLGISNTSLKVLMNNIMSTEKNTMMYAGGNATIEGAIKSTNLLVDGLGTTLDFEKTLAGYQFFDNSHPNKMYFEYNQDAYDFMNASYMLSGGWRNAIYDNKYRDSGMPPAGKYYIPANEIIDDDYDSFKDMMNKQIEQGRKSIVDFFVKANAIVGKYVKAYKQSNTKYTIYGRMTVADINNLLVLMSLQNKATPVSLFKDNDNGYIALSLTFDTGIGMIDSAFSINIDADVTVGEAFEFAGDERAKKNFTEAQLAASLLKIKGNASGTLKAIYDNKVTVDPLKDEKSYAPSFALSHVNKDLFMEEAGKAPKSPQWTSIEIRDDYYGNYYQTIYPKDVEESEEYRAIYETLIVDNSLSSWVDRLNEIEKSGIVRYIDYSFGYAGFSAYVSLYDGNGSELYYSLRWNTYGDITRLYYANYNQGTSFSYAFNWTYTI